MAALAWLTLFTSVTGDAAWDLGIHSTEADIKNTGMPRIINTLAQLLIIDMLCPVVSLDFGISLSIERKKLCSDMPVSPYLHHWYMLLDREDVPSVEASSFFVPLAEGRHPVPVFL